MWAVSFTNQFDIEDLVIRINNDCLTKNRLEGYIMLVGKQISSGGNWTQGKRKRERSNRI